MTYTYHWIMDADYNWTEYVSLEKFVTEHLTAHITAIWKLPSMYTLMYLQATSISKCFMTNITAIMVANQYVHTDVPSDYLCP